jgi:hypothetical protein
VAVTLAFRKPAGWAAGIQIFSSDGKAIRLIDTGRLVPHMLCFDREDNLWALGWQRDAAVNDREDTNDYPLVRKFDRAGRELGRFLPRSLWPGRKSSPGSGSGGYWRMAAASERIGAVIHQSHADNDPEWVEWDLNGTLLSRTVLPDRLDMGRAYTQDGVLYAWFPDRQLRRLETKTGKWTIVRTNLPERIEYPFLFGADGQELVYRVAPGNVRLIFARHE